MRRATRFVLHLMFVYWFLSRNIVNGQACKSLAADELTHRIKDHSLVGHVILNTTAATKGLCFFKCTRECRCTSFNYQPSGHNTCELNDEDNRTHPEAIQPRPGFNFYNVHLVGNIGLHQSANCWKWCCESDPCLNGETCDITCGSVRRIRCHCPQGFSGKLCEMKISPSQSTANVLSSRALKTETVKVSASQNAKAVSSQTENALSNALPSQTVPPSHSQTVTLLPSLTVEPLLSQTVTPSPTRTVSVSSSTINFFLTCSELKKENPDAKDGEHTLYTKSNDPFKTHCQFDDEGFAWTLVMSYMYKNNDAYKDEPLSEGSRRKVRYSDFRLSKGEMNQIKIRSTRWRWTCNFLTGISKRDYAETTFQNLDPLTYTGGSDCKQFLFINVRGNECKMCTVRISQKRDHILYVKNSKSKCSFDASEDSFGRYGQSNAEFSCSSSSNSTTDMWFGMKY